MSPIFSTNSRNRSSLPRQTSLLPSKSIKEWKDWLIQAQKCFVLFPNRILKTAGGKGRRVWVVRGCQDLVLRVWARCNRWTMMWKCTKNSVAVEKWTLFLKFLANTEIQSRSSPKYASRTSTGSSGAESLSLKECPAMPITTTQIQPSKITNPSSKTHQHYGRLWCDFIHF